MRFWIVSGSGSGVLFGVCILFVVLVYRARGERDALRAVCLFMCLRSGAEPELRFGDG
jgi:hypothetical protein